MPAPGSVWATGSWSDDAWAADVWADAVAPVEPEEPDEESSGGTSYPAGWQPRLAPEEFGRGSDFVSPARDRFSLVKHTQRGV